MIRSVQYVEYLIIAVLGVFVAGLMAHTLAFTLFPRMGFLDFPERYGLKRKKLPYPTGVLCIDLFLLTFLLAQPTLPNAWSMQNWGLMLGILILGLTTFFDDRSPVTWPKRLGIQIIVALIIFLSGTRIFTLTNPLGFITGFDVFPLDTAVIPWALFSDPSVIGALFTVIWLGLTMNALNWFDGIPGQVSMLSFLGFLTIGFLSLSDRVDQPHVAFIAFILAALALSALFFDFPPARVVMGDSGSMFFGLMLGVLTIYAGGKVATAFLVLGVPLIDFVIVIGRRLSKGVSIFRRDTQNEHLHHRLLAKGWSPQTIIIATALLGSAFGITALFLSTFEKFLAAILLFLIMLWLSFYSRSESEPESRTR